MPHRDDLISVIVPVYNERETIIELFSLIEEALGKLSHAWDVVFVDDGSTDGSTDVLEKLASDRPDRVRVVQLRGNFGKAAALAAGFEQSEAGTIFTMDADLQDDPSEIPRFLEALHDGFDVVSGYKRQRHDPWHKVLPSRIFNWFVRRLTHTELHDVNCGFKVYRREVLREIQLYGGLHRFVPVLASWRRFRVGEIVVRHHPRRAGRSKYGVRRFSRGIADLLTVTFFTHYQARPAHLFAKVGGGLAAVGIMICLYLSGLWLSGRGPIGDRPLLLLGILLVVVGVQIVGTGLLAELLVRNAAASSRPYSILRILGEPRVDRGST